MLIFCRRIIINNRAWLKKQNNPLLLAVNHPNSFLDAIILDILFQKPVWSLARGDVFKSKTIIRLLTALKMLPVYRISEGAEHLNTNYATFKDCKKIFQQNGIVLIFSEGKCINEWHLRPLKKGTARLAISSWEENIPLQVLPIGINYHSFYSFGKNVFIHFGEPITSADIPMHEAEGIRNQVFNNKLKDQLQKLVFEIDKKDVGTRKKLLQVPVSTFKKLILAIPAFIGWLVHLPLYFPVHKITFKRTAHNDHFDSVMAAILLFAYPVYMILVFGMLFFFTKSYLCLLVFCCMPFTAWSYVQVKPQFDK